MSDAMHSTHDVHDVAEQRIGEVGMLRSQVAALEQLLEVHERTSLEQARRLEQTLHEREQLLDRERSARDALVESEERLRLALDAGRMGTWEWDIQQNCVIWSAEEERLYGVEAGTFSGSLEEYRERIHPADRDAAFALVQQSLNNHAQTHHILHRIVRPDGAVRWLDSHARFMYASDGTPLRLVGVSTDVTDRLEIEAARDRALEQAKAERQRLHEVFMQAPAAIAVLEGPEHTFTVANPLYVELVGGRPVLGKAVAEALPEVVGQGFVDLLNHVYAIGESYQAHEMSVRLDRDQDGVLEDVFLDFVYQPLKNVRGETFGIMVHAVDVTERVVSRRQIESLAAERAAILGQIADVVVTTDPTGMITFFNNAARAIYGDMKLGMTIWDGRQPFELLAADGTPRAPGTAPLERAVRGERVMNEEWGVRRSDGSKVVVVGSAVPVYTTDGALLGAVMTVRDVTVQRELQYQVEHERERLQQILMEAPASISVTEGPDHVLVMQNAISRRMIGGRDIVGMRTRDVFPQDESLQPYIALLDTVYRSGEPFVGNEMPVSFDRNGDGIPEEGYFNFIYQPLQRANGEVYGILTHAVEVTDQVLARREVERKAEELARLTRDLERSNKDLDQFAYVASHDLKAPLRGIANLTQWIEEDLGDKVIGESKEHMQLLKGRVHRMEALIDGILAYSRAGRVRDRPARVDVGALLKEVIELLSPPPETEVVLRADMPVIETERVPLQQVFLNLIGNAIKYSRPPNARIEITACDEGEFYRFAVADNGPGIAPQYREKIWQIFQTLAPRDKVEGTGIGLSVVRKIVEARGGRAWLESEPGSGSTFYFTWPKHQELAQ